MPGPGWRRLVVAELAPIDDLEAALLAVVRGQIRGATLQRVAELLGGRRLTEPGGGLPGALLERAVCARWTRWSGWTGRPCSPCGRWPSRWPKWLRRGWRPGSAVWSCAPRRYCGWLGTMDAWSGSG